MRKGKRDEAVDHLLDIVKRDRKWNDDGARKQLVQFFEAWGPTDEATVGRAQAPVVDLVFVSAVRRPVDGTAGARRSDRCR